MQKKPRALGAARGEVGEPRGVARATRRCDSATPSFIPPLNNKRRAARKPPSDCSVPSPALTISIAQCEAHRDQRDQRWPLSPERPPAAEASRPPPGHRECNVGAILAHSGWSRRVVKGSRHGGVRRKAGCSNDSRAGASDSARRPRREPARSHGYEASPPVEHVRDFRCEEAGLLSQEHPSATNEGAAVRPRRRVDGQIAPRPQGSAASRNPQPNPRQALHAYGPSIASEPLDAVIVFVKAEVFNKDQSPISLTLDHREPHFRDHARAQPQKI
jgi:hypothetical protein